MSRTSPPLRLASLVAVYKMESMNGYIHCENDDYSCILDGLDEKQILEVKGTSCRPTENVNYGLNTGLPNGLPLEIRGLVFTRGKKAIYQVRPREYSRTR